MSAILSGTLGKRVKPGSDYRSSKILTDLTIGLYHTRAHTRTHGEMSETIFTFVSNKLALQDFGKNGASTHYRVLPKIMMPEGGDTQPRVISLNHFHRGADGSKMESNKFP